MQELYHAIFNTPAGWMGLVGSSHGLCRVILPQNAFEDTQRLLSDTVKDTFEGHRRFDRLIERFIMFFQGKKVDFNDDLDLTSATSFQREVWEATRLIAYGETKSYRWVAEQIGKPQAFRAVGQALGRNPLPVIIPCHRVLSSDGKLGGFSSGLTMKVLLLKLEKRRIADK